VSTLQSLPADPQPPTSKRAGFGWRHVFAIFAGVSLLLAVCVALLAWYANTARFQDRVRRQVIATIEQATGGRVELKSFRWRLIHLQLEARDLTIHGLEAPGEIPYAHIDRLGVRAKILSFFLPKIGLTLLSADHPVFHLIVYPDGSTNQPQPKAVRNGKPLGDTLFDLAIDKVELADGLAIVNERKIPFDLSANNLGATITYSVSPDGKDRYLANVTASDLMAHRAKEPPVHSTLDLSMVLSRNAAELKSFRLKTGPSLLEASGIVDNFSDPQWHLAMTGKIDVREVEALTEVEGLGGGIADLRLNGEGNGANKFVIEGDALVDKAVYRTPYVTLKDVNVTTRIRATEQKLSLTDVVAKLRQGGVIQGEFQLDNWLPAPPPSAVTTPTSAVKTAKQSKKAAPAQKLEPLKPQLIKAPPVKAMIRAKLEGVTLRSVLAATAAPRFQDIGFDTAASGPVSVDWNGSGDDLTLDAQLTMAPVTAKSVRDSLSEVPLTGELDAEYYQRTGAVEIRKLAVKTPGTHLTVQGGLGVYPVDRTSSLQGDLTTTNLAEFDRTLTALGLVGNGKKGVQAIPIELQGQAEFHGQVTGTITEPTVTGHLTATNFATILPAQNSTQPAQVANANLTAANPGERKIQWDRLDATGEYSLEQITIQQATIARGKTLVHATGLVRPHRIGPHRADFDEKSAINATLRVDDANIADVLDIAGQSQLPVTGALSLDMHAGGTFDNLDGGGHLVAKGGEIYGEPYRSLVADMRFAGRELSISKLTLLQDGGQIVADGAYDLGRKSFRASAQGRGFQLSHMQRLQRPNMAIAGRVEFDAQGSGSLENPIIHANAHLFDFEWGGQLLGNVDANAHSDNGSLFYTTDSHLRGAALKISGQTELRGDYLTQAKLVFSGLDIDPFLRLTKVEGLTAHSSIQGELTVSGPLKEPKRLNGEASVSQFAVSLAGVPLQSDGPMHAVLKNGVLSLDPLHVTGEDTNLRAKGSMNILEHGDLNFHADGEVNLKLAQTVNPDVASSGRMDFTLDARGTFDRPDLTGQVRFTNAAMALQDLPNGLSQINGTLQFNQDRLDVKSLTAQTGGGQLKIGGYITYLQGLYGDLTASGTNIRIRYPTGVSSMADATLRLQGSSKNLILSGNVQITRFAINPNLDIAGLAGSATSVAPPVDPNAPSNHVRLDIHITSAPALNFQNSFAKLAGDVDLHVRGTVASPSVLGRINVTEGSANFAGTQYQLQHGDIFFTNPVRVDPSIDLDATARVENYDITIGLHGTANKLNVSYRSEPPLPQADVIALLALGRTQEEQGMLTQQQQNAGTNSTTNALLGGALNATVSSRVQKLFGVGSVKIDPTFVGSLGNSTARITVEQQISKNVIVTYATNVNSTAQQLIQAQVNVTRNVSVVALRDENGVFSTVVKVHRRYR
jgi:translocation and assembly module TamB